MPVISWNDNLSVGIATIDGQHKSLIEVLNDFGDAVIAGQSSDRMSKTLKSLTDYTVFHFQAEEKLMQQYGYPDLAEHKKEHEEFILKVNDLNAKFSQGNLSLSMSVLNFLLDWVKNHIRQTDKKYTDFFKRHGVN